MNKTIITALFSFIVSTSLFAENYDANGVHVVATPEGNGTIIKAINKLINKNKDTDRKIEVLMKSNDDLGRRMDMLASKLEGVSFPRTSNAPIVNQSDNYSSSLNSYTNDNNSLDVKEYRTEVDLLVRKGPSRQNPRVNGIQKGEHVFAKALNNGWSFIPSKGGYAYSRYLIPIESTTPTNNTYVSYAPQEINEDTYDAKEQKIKELEKDVKNLISILKKRK